MAPTIPIENLHSLRATLAHAVKFRGIDKVLGAKFGGHTQTLIGHFLPSRQYKIENASRVELELPEGDVLVGFYSKPTDRERGLLHIFHGLAGSSDSQYVPRAAKAALDLGFAVVCWNHRGCGAGRGLALEPYHSGRSDDLARAVRWGRDKFKDDSSYLHGVLGYSLSANAACLLAGKIVPAIDATPLSPSEFAKIGALPDFAIAVCPPFNLETAAFRIAKGSSRLYGQSFMIPLLESLDDRIKMKTTSERRDMFRRLAEKARARMTLMTDVVTFDSLYTGPAAGFRDHFDYYHRASSGPYLEKAQIPLVILSADDDPITHGRFDLLSRTSNPNVIFDLESGGGHLGFIDGASLLSPWSKKLRWMERRIQTYLSALAAGVS